MNVIEIEMENSEGPPAQVLFNDATGKIYLFWTHLSRWKSEGLKYEYRR